MRFEIEIKDFWIEEGELTQELVKEIKSQIVGQILPTLKAQVQEKIFESTTKEISEKVTEVVNGELSRLIESGTLVNRDNKVIPIIDHVRNIFNNHHGWNSANDILARLAKGFGEELKLQYNAAFANKIVQNMKEQGLLRDDVVQILLGENTEKLPRQV